MAAIKNLAPDFANMGNRHYNRRYDFPQNPKSSWGWYNVEYIDNLISTNWSLIPQEFESAISYDFLAISQPSKIEYPDAPGLLDVLTDVCKQQSNFSTAEFVNWLSDASPGEIAAVTSAAESVCNGAGELDPQKLLYDSLIHCRLGKCLAQAQVLQRRNGYIDFPDLLMNRGFFYQDEDAEQNRVVLKHFYEFAKNNLSRDFTKLVLGSLINDVCEVDSDCRSRSVVKEAVELLESRISQSCSEKEDLVLLKALGNGGVFSDVNERCLMSGNEETISTAIDAMRKTPCTDQRFNVLTAIMEENRNPEIRQMALLSLWKCPSTELRDYLLQASIEEESSDMLNLMKTLNVNHQNLMGFNASDWSALLSGNSMVLKNDYIQVEKLNDPGSIIPRRLNIDIMNFLKFGYSAINVISDFDAFEEAKEFIENKIDVNVELRLRAVNLENELVKIFNSNYDFDEDTFGQRGGEFKQPQLRLDIRVNDNDVFSIEIEDIKALFLQIAEDYERTVNLSIFDKMKVALGYEIGLLKYFKNENFDFQRTFWLPDFTIPDYSIYHPFFQKIVRESFKQLKSTMTTVKMKTDLSLDSDWRFALKLLIKAEDTDLILLENSFLERQNYNDVEEFEVVFGKHGWRIARKINDKSAENSLEYSNVDGFSFLFKSAGGFVSLVYSESTGELEFIGKDPWSDYKGVLKTVDGELRGSYVRQYDDSYDHAQNCSLRLYDQVPAKERSFFNMIPTAELVDNNEGNRFEISLENRENIVKLFGVGFSKKNPSILSEDDSTDTFSSSLVSVPTIWSPPTRPYMNRTLAILDGKYGQNETIDEFYELEFTRTVEIGKASAEMSFVTDSQFGQQGFFQTGITVEDDKANVFFNIKMDKYVTADFQLNSNWRSGKDFTKYLVKISQLDIKSDMITVHFDKGKMSFTQNHVQKSKCPAAKGGFIAPQKEVDGTFDFKFDINDKTELLDMAFYLNMADDFSKSAAGIRMDVVPSYLRIFATKYQLTTYYQLTPEKLIGHLDGKKEGEHEIDIKGKVSSQILATPDEFMLETLYKWTWYSDTSKTGLRTNWKVKDPRNIFIRFEPIVDEDNFPVTFKFLDKSNRRPDYYVELTHDIDGFLWLPKQTHLQLNEPVDGHYKALAILKDDTVSSNYSADFYGQKKRTGFSLKQSTEQIYSNSNYSHKSAGTIFAIKSSDESSLKLSVGYSTLNNDEDEDKCMMTFASDNRPEKEETWRRNARLSIKNSRSLFGFVSAFSFYNSTIYPIFGKVSGFKFYVAENNSKLTSYLELARKGEEENELQRITTGLLVDPKKSTTALLLSLDISEDLNKKFKIQGQQFEDTGSVLIKVSEVREPENLVLGEISYFVKPDEFDFTIEVSDEAALDYFTQSGDFMVGYFSKIRAAYQSSRQYFVAEFQDRTLSRSQESISQWGNNSTLTIPNGLRPNENGEVATLKIIYDEDVGDINYVLSMDKKQKRISLYKEEDENFNFLSISIAPYDVLNDEIWTAPIYDTDNINGKNVIAVDIFNGPASNKQNKLRLSGGGLVNYVEDLLGLEESQNDNPGVLLMLSIVDVSEFLLTKSDGLFHAHLKSSGVDSTFLKFKNIDETTSVGWKLDYLGKYLPVEEYIEVFRELLMLENELEIRQIEEESSKTVDIELNVLENSPTTTQWQSAWKQKVLNIKYQSSADKDVDLVIEKQIIENDHHCKNSKSIFCSKNEKAELSASNFRDFLTNFETNSVAHASYRFADDVVDISVDIDKVDLLMRVDTIFKEHSHVRQNVTNVFSIEKIGIDLGKGFIDSSPITKLVLVDHLTYLKYGNVYSEKIMLGGELDATSFLLFFKVFDLQDHHKYGENGEEGRKLSMRLQGLLDLIRPEHLRANALIEWEVEDTKVLFFDVKNEFTEFEEKLEFSSQAKIEAADLSSEMFAIDPKTVDLFLTIGDSSELIFGYNGEYDIDADWRVDVSRSEEDSIRSIELKLNPFLEVNHEQKDEPMIDIKMNLEIEPEYKVATLNEFLMLIDNDVFYEFEVTHANFRMNDEHVELVAEMFHNIDFLHHELAILPHTRIDAAADYPANEPFKAFATIQGAEGKHEQMYLVHDIDLKCDYKLGGLQDFYGTGWLKTTSPILPEEISFNILADLDDGNRIEVGYNMTGGTEEKNRAIHGARFGQLEFAYSNDGQLKTLLDLAEGSARVDGQVSFNGDSGFKEISLDFNGFEETFELLLNTSDSFLSSEVYVSRAEEELVRISYDFENSHKEGIVFNILENKNRIIVNEDWRNSRLTWVLETNGDNHNFKNYGVFVKRPNYKVTSDTFLSGFGLEEEQRLNLSADLLEDHDKDSEEKYTLAMTGQYNEHKAQLTPMMALRYKTRYEYGTAYKDGAPIGGSAGLKWAMPTCRAFHSFSTEASVDIDGRVGGGLEVQVNENEPIKLDVRYVGHDKGATFGVESKLGGIMQHVDERIIEEWMLARSSADILVSADWSLHTYSLTVTPDGRKYHFRGSYERDGVTIYFTQPNRIENVPTWGSIHCEGGSDDEFHVSCNAKALVNDITREVNTKFSSIDAENTVYNFTSNVNEFDVFYKDQIHGEEKWSFRRETRSDGFFSFISFHENEKGATSRKLNGFDKKERAVVEFKSIDEPKDGDKSRFQEKFTKKNELCKICFRFKLFLNWKKLTFDLDKNTRKAKLSVDRPGNEEGLEIYNFIVPSVTDVTRELFNANGSRSYDSNIRLIIDGDRADDGALEFKFGLKIGKHDYTVNVRHFAERKKHPGVLILGSESYLDLAGSRIPIQGTFVELYKDFGQTGIRLTVNEYLARFYKTYISGEDDFVDEVRFYLYENFGDFGAKFDQITGSKMMYLKYVLKILNPLEAIPESYSEMVLDEMGFLPKVEIRNLLENIIYVGDAEVFIAIPINIPDQMPEDFDLAAAIRGSAPVQIAGTLSDVDFWVDIWFHIRAFIAKERAPFSGRAWIVGNKYVHTFDGGDGILNGDVIIHNNLNNEILSKVGSDEIYGKFIEIREINLPWTMFGNIEGSFGTMSREISDDFDYIEKRELNSSSVEACQVESLRPRNARRALRPCLPIVDIEPFRKMLLEEDCNKVPSCAIMAYYVRRCAAEGILIESSCY